MTGPRDLNSPLPAGKICNADGTPTMQFAAFIRRMWERTGYSPGVDVAWEAREIDVAYLSAQSALKKADQAESSAREAADLSAVLASSLPKDDPHKILAVAIEALLKASQAEARALKALEKAEELARIFLTTREPRDGISSDESMTFSVMTRIWQSSHNPS
ncbi:hypothetical protein HW537_10945 [Asaia siamensis]